jgi:hypothetical protein
MFSMSLKIGELIKDGRWLDNLNYHSSSVKLHSLRQNPPFSLLFHPSSIKWNEACSFSYEGFQDPFNVLWLHEFPKDDFWIRVSALLLFYLRKTLVKCLSHQSNVSKLGSFSIHDICSSKFAKTTVNFLVPL